VHGAQLLSSTPGLLKVYVKAVKGGAKAPEVQAVATVAASKLLLGRVVNEEAACQDLLKSLVVAYFDPSSASNQTVRQALNYFLPVFCFSRAENQDLMRSIALDAIHSLFNLRESLEDDDVDVGEDMVSMTAIGACLVDWTDPRKCYSPTSLLDTDKKLVNGDVHLEFAMDIIEKLTGNITSRFTYWSEERHMLINLQRRKRRLSPRFLENFMFLLDQARRSFARPIMRSALLFRTACYLILLAVMRSTRFMLAWARL
jgi:condensin complex subunit 3